MVYVGVITVVILAVAAWYYRRQLLSITEVVASTPQEQLDELINRALERQRADNKAADAPVTNPREALRDALKDFTQ